MIMHSEHGATSKQAQYGRVDKVDYDWPATMGILRSACSSLDYCLVGVRHN